MSFQKKCTPWNKGKKLSREHIENLSKSHLGQHSSPTTQFKKGDRHTEVWKKKTSKRMKQEWEEGERSNPFEEESRRWKGDKVGYRTLHKWVEKHLGKACHCEDCGLNKIPKGLKRYFQWANLSHQYKRILEDWKQLCLKCHKKYDMAHRKVNA